jgi:hypothetical protein
LCLIHNTYEQSEFRTIRRFPARNTPTYPLESDAVRLPYSQWAKFGRTLKRMLRETELRKRAPSQRGGIDHHIG